MTYTLAIDRYLDGTLSREEYNEFLEMIQSDPKFEKSVERYRRLSKFIQKEFDNGLDVNLSFDKESMEFVNPKEIQSDFDLYYHKKNDMQESNEIIAFRKQLEEYHQDMLNNPDIIKENKNIFHRTSSGVKWYMAAASILVVLVSGALLYFGNHKTVLSNEEIYTAYYQPTINEMEFVRGAKYKNTEIFNKAMDKYNIGQFAEAQLLFKQIVNDPSYVASYLYLGRSYMQTQNFTEAVNAFKHYNENDIFIGYANWYTGLCYLKLDDRKNAVKYFEKTTIIGSREYKDKARKILEKLK